MPIYEDNLENALRFVERSGIPVFPVWVKKSGKHTIKSPKITNPFENDSTDPERIRRWWGRYRGKCAFAAFPGKGGFAVVDLDCKNGKNGFEELAVWEMLNCDLPDTLAVSTPSGGEHLWFRDSALQAGKDGFLSGVDVHGSLAANGRYVLLPGQMISTGSYQIKKKKEIAVLPKQFAEAVNKSLSDRKTAAEVKGVPGDWMDFAHVLAEIQSMDPIPCGRRDNSLFAICADWKERGISHDGMLQLMLLMDRLGKIDPGDDPLDENDFMRIAGSAWKREATAFGTRSIGAMLTDLGSPETDGYSAAELSSLELPPPDFLIEGILPEGIAMIGGAAKSGKTYLLLDMAICLASGTPFLGREVEKPLKVLYVYLEGGMRQVKKRIAQIRGESFIPPSNLFFIHQLPPLNAGGLPQLKKIAEELRPDVIIIDTWQLVRSPVNSKATAYEKEYAEFAGLRSQIFRGMGLRALILAHHFKQFRSGDITDPLSMLNGSAAIGGAVDTALLLFRDRGAETATLTIHGRDIEDAVVELVKTDPMGWKTSAGGRTIRLVAETEFQRALLSALETEENGLTAREVTARLPGKDYNSVHKQLDRWFKAGKLDRNGKRYRLFAFVEEGFDDSEE